MAAIMTALRSHDFQPDPIDPFPVDGGLTDWELFRKYCLNEDYYLVGDLWVDVAWV